MIADKWIITDDCLKGGMWYCYDKACTKPYGRKQYLQRHINTAHLKNQAYECPFDGCGKVFGYKENMKTHYNSVHMKKKKICKLCGKELSSPEIAT